jgi:hypothetical protein
MPITQAEAPMHDDPTTPDRSRQPGRGWLRRRRQPETDSVRIDAEASYAWWAGRDEVDASAAVRRTQDRVAPEPPSAVSAAAMAFAPSADPAPGDEPATEPSDGPRRGWDTESLFRWVDTTVDPATRQDQPEPSARGTSSA